MSRFEQRLRRELRDSDELRRGFEEGVVEFNLAQALERARVRRGITKTELAERMGAKRPFVSRKLSHPENMEIETFARFLRGLGMRAEIVIREARATEPTLYVANKLAHRATGRRQARPAD
jgi:transcriptional regulator with XRE-family HTH domain